MTREDAIKILQYRRNIVSNADAEWCVNEAIALDLALSSLRPVSREQVEKVWKSEWIDNGERAPNGVPKTFAISCKRCGLSVGTSWMRFCPACGAPMTDEAVDIIMRRLETLYETT